MSSSWSNKLRRLRADLQNSPGFTAWTALLVIAISAVDLLEIPPVFHPVVASRIFPFFHDIHDLLAVGVVLFVAYRKHTYLAYVSGILFLSFHIPYFILESPVELPEFLRIFSTAIIALFGTWLIDNIYEADRKLTTSRNMYFELAEGLPDAYVIVQDDKLVYVNVKTAELLGYSQKDLITRPFIDLIAPEERPRIIKMYRERLAGQAAPARYNTILLAKFELRVPVELSVKLVEWNGRPATSGLIRDISERLAAQAKIFKQTEELGALHRVSNAISSLLKSEEVLSISLEKAMEVTRSEGGEIWLQEGDTLVVKQQKGLPLLEEPISFKIGQGIPGIVVQSGKSTLISDLAREPLFLRKQFVEAGFTSMLSIPLTCEKGLVIGAIGLFLKDRKSFTYEDISFAETVAQSVATAVRNSMLYEESQKQAEEMEQLYVTSHAVTSITNIDDLTKQSLERMAAICPGNIASASILTLSPEKEELVIKNAIGPEVDSRRGLTLTFDMLKEAGLSQLLAKFIETGQILIFNDLQKLPPILNYIKDLKCAVVIPLVTRNRVIGLISMNSSTICLLNHEDMRRLSIHARHIASALESALLVEEMLEKVQELTSLQRVSQAVAESQHPETVAQQALEASLRVLNLDAGSVRYLNEETQELVLLDHKGMPQELFQEMQAHPTLKVGEGLAGRVVLSKEPLVLHDVSRLPYLAYKAITHSGFKTFIGIPLKVKEQVIGAITGFSRLDRTFNQADIGMLSSLGNMVGIALTNARLFSQTDEALKQRVVEVEAIISSMGEGLIIVNTRGIVTHCSPAAERLLGLKAGDFLGQLVTKLNDFIDTRIVEPKDWRKKLAVGLGDITSKFKLQFSIQLPISRELELTPFAIDKGSNRLGTGVTIRDITREREIDKMKSEFVSIAAHELRTPMTVICGFAELLTISKDISGEHREWLEKIHKETGRLNNIVDDLLNISRIESGRLSIKLEALSLQPIVSQLISQLGAIYNAHSFKGDIPENFPELWADGEKLTQVIYNLMDNAAKYSPNGGLVTISVYRVAGKDEATIAIMDSGLGIPEEELPRLFTRFHRVQRPETESIRGTGLGLSIVKSIVEMMGGRVWVESQLKKGSTFYVALPLVGTN